jgi:hypothetical protein
MDWVRDKLDALGPRGDYIFAGALALLILLALGYSVYATFFTSPGGDIPQPKDDKTHFICRACKHEIALEPTEVRDMRRRMEREEDLMRLDCPNCDREQSMLRATWCYNCHDYYLSPHTRALAELKPGEEPEDLPADVCTHCGTNQREWMKEHVMD